MGLKQQKDQNRKQLSSALYMYCLFLPLRTSARVLSHGQAVKLGAVFGEMLYWGAGRYREVALRNLTCAFGWDSNRAVSVAREAFRNIGKTLVEFLRLPTYSEQELRGMCHLEGIEHVRRGLDAGRGVLIISAHYGNWELFAARVVIEGIPLNVVAREADGAATNGLINEIREQCGYHVIPRQSAARGVLEALRRNEAVALLMDQNTVEGGEFVPFFGRPAATVTGPAVFAHRTGACLIPAFAQRQPDNTHIGRIQDPVTVQRTGDRNADVIELTAYLTATIEAQIRADPTQWFWIHDRWRHRPPGEQSLGGQ